MSLPWPSELVFLKSRHAKVPCNKVSLNLDICFHPNSTGLVSMTVACSADFDSSNFCLEIFCMSAYAVSQYCVSVFCLGVKYRSETWWKIHWYTWQKRHVYKPKYVRVYKPKYVRKVIAWIFDIVSSFLLHVIIICILIP